MAATLTRILIIDDSAVMRKAALKMLDGHFDIVTAEDGLDGWEKLQADASIQVVFTDLSMPVLNGYGLLEKIRAALNSNIRSLPVIVMTSTENDHAARLQALNKGATDFIAKPFTATDLLARAKAHADHQRVTRQLQDQATIDFLTGLMNKSGIVERLRQDIAFAKRHQQPLTVAMLEIDRFDALSHQHGRRFSDSLLIRVAKIIRSHIRKEDSAARVGRAVFLISLLASKHLRFQELVRRIDEELRAEPLEGAGVAVMKVTMSAGATTPALNASLDVFSVMKASRQLLEAAHEQGGGLMVCDVDAPQQGMPAPVAKMTPQEQLGIEVLLRLVKQGDVQAIGQFPQVVDRLEPLLRLLSKQQRQQLITLLHKLG